MGKEKEKLLGGLPPEIRMKTEAAAAEIARRPQPAAVAQAASETGAEPLKNSKWEKFCSIITGWGGDGFPVYAYQAYMKVYGTTDRHAARCNASRLIASHAEVRERIMWMKSRLAESALIDKSAMRKEILDTRLAILNATKGSSKHKDIALQVMRDIERAFGLDGPELERKSERVDEAKAAAQTDGAFASIREALKRVTTTMRE